MRLMIFIDFWNLQLQWNWHHQRAGAAGVVRIPWRDKFPQTLVRRVGGADGVYAGTHVYVSYDPDSEKDRGLSIDDYYDRAVLISGDADHVPAVDFLGRRMKRVTHAWFRGQSHELRNACWDHIMLDDCMADLVEGP